MDKQGGIERLLDTQPMGLEGAFPQLGHRRLHRLERPQNVGTGGAEHLNADRRIAILIPELLAGRRGDIDRREIGKSNGTAVTPRQYEIPKSIRPEQSGEAQCVLAAADVELSA